MTRPKLLLILALTGIALSACGIKPGHLTPPKGEKNDTFPRVYPNDPEHPNKKDHYSDY